MAIKIDTKVKCDVPNCPTPDGQGSISVSKNGAVTGPGTLPNNWVWGGQNGDWALCPKHAKGPRRDEWNNLQWD